MISGFTLKTYPRGGRLAVRVLVPAAERDAVYAIAAPLTPALGALFAAAGSDVNQRHVCRLAVPCSC